MADEGEGLWLSVAELGRARGISRQSAAERVGRLERLGQLTTRPGAGRSKLVNLAEFDRATADTVDGVRAINGGGSLVSSPAASAPIVSTDPVLVKEQARRAAYDADLKRLDLLERLGILVQVDRLREDTTEIAGHMLRALDRLPSKLDEMMAVCGQGPAAGRRFLRDLGIELRTVIATNLQDLTDDFERRPKRDIDDIAIPQDSELWSRE